MRKIILTTLFITTYTLFTFGQNSKRGLAYGYHSPEDLEALSPHVSWWYNWSETPDNAVADNFSDYGFEFTPMTWNGNYNETKLRNFLSDHPETKYLLAFNEPNFLEQANMTPSEVAAEWPKLEAIADEFNLEIVGPAVNYCGGCVEENGTTYNDPVEYLDDFFDACVDCRVDHIAVHTYVNTIGALEWFIGLFQKYNKPIWLTEFAGWESNGVINNVNDQINFMESALEYLDNEPSVFRYAWFIGRTSGGIDSYPHIDILGANGELTALGEVYAAEPFIRDVNRVTEIPGYVFAEDYNYMEGISLEGTADNYGDKNVGYIDAGDWLDYDINVAEGGTYDLHLRLASTRTATVQILIDDEVTVEQNIDNFGGWQSWNTVSSTIDLPEGHHTMRVLAVTAGFNINWIGIGAEPEPNPDPEPDPEPVLNTVRIDNQTIIYPNPGNGLFKIATTTPLIKLSVYDLNGQIVLEQSRSHIIDLRHMNKGVYLLKLLTEKHEIITTKLSVK